MKTTTQNELYFVNYSTLARMPFQFVPMDVTDNRSHDTTKHKVVGRNHPIIQSMGGTTTLNFSVSIYGDDVKTRAVFFKQFTLREGLNEPPALMKIIWAGLISDNDLWVVDKADISYSLFTADNSFSPNSAKVVLSLTKWTRTNVFFNDINLG